MASTMRQIIQTTFKRLLAQHEQCLLTILRNYNKFKVEIERVRYGHNLCICDIYFIFFHLILV